MSRSKRGGAEERLPLLAWACTLPPFFLTRHDHEEWMWIGPENVQKLLQPGLIAGFKFLLEVQPLDIELAFGHGNLFYWAEMANEFGVEAVAPLGGFRIDLLKIHRNGCRWVRYKP